MPVNTSRVRSLTTCGLMIALLSVSAMIVVPLGPVPFTLQTAVVILCILVLSPTETCIVIAGYLALGAFGVPIFSGFRGGLGVIVGPTGGFLIGFLLGGATAAFLRQMLLGRGKTCIGDVAAAAIALVVSYVFGWMQLALVAHMGLGAAFLAGVAPFVLIDIAKAAVAIGIANALRKALPSLATSKSR